MFSIKHYKRIDRSDALPLLAQGWHEQIQDGLISEWIIPVYGGWPAIVAYNAAGQPVGFIHYTSPEDDATIHIRFGYVHPDWRRNGCYRQLYSRLREMMDAEGVRAITGGTHWKNDKLQAAAKAAGRELESYAYVDRLRPDPRANIRKDLFSGPREL